MKLPITGDCACGAIRYESTTEPVMMLECHCRDCQRASGGASSELVVVPKEAFKLVKGELRFHASPSEAKGMTRRGFCADAVRRLPARLTRLPTLLSSDPQAWTTQVGSNRRWMF